MSHIVPIIVVALLIWQWLARARRKLDASAKEPAGLFEQIAEEFAEKLSEQRSEGGGSREAASEIGEALSGLFGERGQELLARTVTRVLDNPEVERKLQEVLQPAAARIEGNPKQKQAVQDQRVQRQPRTRYLLDGEDGYRQKIDRTARLQQAMRGKGLCSPR